MFPLLRSLTARYLLQKWDRSLLVALSIALGVATLVSSRLLNQCVDAAALDTTVPLDQADLYVNTGEQGVDSTLADKLRAAGIPGLDRVERFVHARVDLPQLGERRGVVFARDVSSNAGVTDPMAALGRLRVSVELKLDNVSRGARWVLVSKTIYDERVRAGLKDSDPVLVKYTQQPVTFALAGVIDVARDSPLAPYANTLLVTNVTEASRLVHPNRTGGPARVSRIDLFVRPGADVEQVLPGARAVVGGAADVQTREDNRKSTDEIIGGVKLVLDLCSLGAIIVGLFLVYNAMAVTVAERRHDIGVLRSLGATRGQIAGLFTGEAILLGTLGAVAGIPLGMGLAELAIRVFGEELSSAFLNAGESFRPRLTAATVVVALAGGILTSLFAALIPSVQAAADEPADAVRRAPSGTNRFVRWTHRLTCGGLVAAGALTMLSREHLPSRTGAMVGLSLVLVGLQLAMPIFSTWLARLLHAPCRWLFGIEARLAADNLIRSPARTGVVIGALAAGVALMFQTAGVGKSNEVPIRNWLEEVIRADAFLFRGNPVSANSSMTPMEPEVRDDLQKLPGVERVVGLRFNRIKYGGTFILMVGIDAVDYQRGVLDRGRPDSPALERMEQLPDGDYTIVSDNFAAKWNVHEGDTLTFKRSGGDIQLKVIGVGRDYSWSMGTVFVDRARYAELFADPRVDAFHVFFKPDADFDATYETVRQYADREGLLVQNRESVYLYLAGVLERIFRIAYLQQVIVAVVATLGVVMALLISVLQRRRELGLLRAVGATQPQVLKSVVAEATLMGLLGTVLGLLMGLPMEWYLLRVVLQEETGFVFDLLIPWKEAVGIALIAVLTSTLAGLVPALHAARLRIPDAIAYE